MLLFSGCMDDIVTVLAEEHGCLDSIKVESKPLVAFLLVIRYLLNSTIRYFIHDDVLMVTHCCKKSSLRFKYDLSGFLQALPENVLELLRKCLTFLPSKR